MEKTGYLYKTTWLPEGLMYFGSRKLPEGVTASEDTGYMGSPKGTSKMLELRKTRPESEFAKVILYVGKYEVVRELEPLLIKESWDKWGKYSEGGLVTCLAAGKAIDVRGIPKSIAHRDAISSTLMGHGVSPSTRRKMSLAKKGKRRGPHSAETKAKMSAAAKGRALSAATKAKISVAKKGKKFGPPSAETRAKISAAKKGKTHSAETKAKMSAARGRRPPPSAETKAKLSAAAKASWAKRKATKK